MDIAAYLWGERAKFRYLFFAAIILLFAFLGARELWTQEFRWAEIVSGMFYRRDFLHPYIGQLYYYDKPLVSYWMMAFFALLHGKVSLWSLRFPSALAGLLSIYCVYDLGCFIKDRHLGLLSGWLLLTSFFFIFWARTSSADMLNMAGILFAVQWYQRKKSRAQFTDYLIFFAILATTALCKGLVAIAIAMMLVFVDIAVNKSWKNFCNRTLWFAILLSMVLYLLPFVISMFFHQGSFANSLYYVYRENFVRYFSPFDHRSSVFIYFIFLPLYLLPWTIFFIPAFISNSIRIKYLAPNQRWLLLAIYLMFAFFTVSGSRRSYYILPLLPFAIILTAEWCLSAKIVGNFKKTGRFIILSFSFLFLYNCIVPFFYQSKTVTSAHQFTLALHQQRPEIPWHFVFINVDPKFIYYLHLPPAFTKYDLQCMKDKRCLPNALPYALKSSTIFVIEQKNYKILAPYFVNYDVFALMAQNKINFFRRSKKTIIAFIPRK